MPISKMGGEVMSAMKKEYGNKKGESVFYASMNKGNPGSSKWHAGKHIHEIAHKMRGNK